MQNIYFDPRNWSQDDLRDILNAIREDQGKVGQNGHTAGYINYNGNHIWYNPAMNADDFLRKNGNVNRNAMMHNIQYIPKNGNQNPRQAKDLIRDLGRWNIINKLAEAGSSALYNNGYYNLYRDLDTGKTILGYRGNTPKGNYQAVINTASNAVDPNAWVSNSRSNHGNSNNFDTDGNVVEQADGVKPKYNDSSDHNEFAVWGNDGSGYIYDDGFKHDLSNNKYPSSNANTTYTDEGGFETDEGNGIRLVGDANGGQTRYLPDGSYHVKDNDYWNLYNPNGRRTGRVHVRDYEYAYGGYNRYDDGGMMPPDQGMGGGSPVEQVLAMLSQLPPDQLQQVVQALMQMAQGGGMPQGDPSMMQDPSMGGMPPQGGMPPEGMMAYGGYNRYANGGNISRRTSMAFANYLRKKGY